MALQEFPFRRKQVIAGWQILVVSTKSGQVAIATENFLAQYCCHVSRLNPSLSVRGFILQPLILANAAYRRRAEPANRKQNYSY